jgi:hypothetical protein
MIIPILSSDGEESIEGSIDLGAWAIVSGAEVNSFTL